MGDYAKPEHHIVTVHTDTDDDSTYLESVECSCVAPYDAHCRTYPKCDCEVFTVDHDNPGFDTNGHPYVKGRDCWVTSWFQDTSCAEATTYVGADRTDRTDCGVPLANLTGHISIVGFEGDTGPEWEWYGRPGGHDAPAPIAVGDGQIVMDFTATDGTPRG